MSNKHVHDCVFMFSLIGFFGFGFGNRNVWIWKPECLDLETGMSGVYGCYPKL